MHYQLTNLNGYFQTIPSFDHIEIILLHSTLPMVGFKYLQTLERILPFSKLNVQGAQRYILSSGSACGNFVCEGYGTLGVVCSVTGHGVGSHVPNGE